MALAGTFTLTTLFFEWALLRHPFSRMFFLGSCLVVLGVICLSARSRQALGGHPVRLALGVFLALVGSLLWGLSTGHAQAGDRASDGHPGQQRPPSAGSPGPFPNPVLRLQDIDRRALFIVAVSGIIGMGIGSMLFLMAIDRIGPAKMAILASVSPVFGLIMAIIFQKEEMTLRLVAGVGLCVAGVWMVL